MLDTIALGHRNSNDQITHKLLYENMEFIRKVFDKNYLIKSDVNILDTRNKKRRGHEAEMIILILLKNLTV